MNKAVKELDFETAAILRDEIGVLKVRIEKKEDLKRYGIADVEKVEGEERVFRIKSIVEKPDPDKAPSNIATHGAYILPPEIFKFITSARKQAEGKGEVSVVDVLKSYLASGGELFGWVFRGRHFDGGSKPGLLKAGLYFGGRHKEFGPALKKYLKSL